MCDTLKLGKRRIKCIENLFNSAEGPNTFNFKYSEKICRLSKTAPKKSISIQNLPVEIMTNIFELMDFKTRIVAERVCHRWNNIIQAHSWRNTKFLNFCRIKKDKFAAVAKRCAPYLKSAKLGTLYCSFNYCWNTLLSQIPENQLQHLSFYASKTNLAQLLQISQRFSALKSFEVEAFDAHEKSLSAFFKSFTSLQNLVLDGCYLRNVSFEKIPQTLRKLELSCDSFLRKVDNVQLAQIGDRCTQLERLKIGGAIGKCDLNLLLRRLKLESSSDGKSRKRLRGGGRPLTFKDLDNQLAAWVRESRKKKLKVSRRIIQQQGERMFNAEADGNGFTASLGWLDKFLHRHNFTLRATTTVCQKPPADYAQKLVDFVLYVSQLRQKHNFQSIYAADETAVWLDPSGGKCIDERGVKEVSVLTTGHDKMRVTVMLTARADGFKCKPYVLLSRKRPDIQVVKKFGNKLNLSWAGKIWMDDELTSDYLDKTFGRSLFGKRLLVWDSFRCHISQQTKKKLREIGLYSAVVPGGCTKFIQAPDVVWNGPFKAKIQQLYNTWMMNDAEKEFTANGNPRAPSMNVYLEWVCQAWESLPKETIAKSFKDCGITNASHAGEDDLIHCFKPHGPVPEGFQLLHDARLNLDDLPLIEELDSEQDEENGYLSDRSLDEKELEIYSQFV